MVDPAVIRKRGSLKASLTSFTKFVDSCRQSEHLLTDIQIMNLRERLQKIKDVFCQFNEVQGEIEGEVDENELDLQYEHRFQFENVYFEYVAVAKILLPQSSIAAVQENEQSSASSISQALSNNNADNSGTSQVKIGVKLPDIPLPSFDGSFERWLEFRDTFESLINSNNDLSNVQKFHYLRASLEGKAAEVIKSIEFSENGYSIAWNALVSRFNNSKLLVHNHLKAIFSLENINKESSVKIRNLIDQLAKHLSLIRQLGHNTDNWDTLLIFMLSAKLDSRTSVDWERFSVQSDSPTLSDFTKFLRDKADVLETIEQKSTFSRDRQVKEYPRGHKQTSCIAGAMLCYYCNNEHSIYSCDQFLKLSLDEKWKFVKGRKLCKNCLRNNHLGKQCVMGPCRKCRQYHNTLLHLDKKMERASNDPGNSFSEGDSEQIVAAISNQVPQKNCYQSYVFLSTARIKVFDSNGKVLFARALLDSGSQSSFIAESLCKRLGLETSQINLAVFGIANRVSNIKSKCILKMGSEFSNFQAKLPCFVLPQITQISVINNFSLRDLQIPHNIKLADPEALAGGPIDVLIGADLFWDLLHQEKILLGKGLPSLRKTEFGWIVTGAVGGQRYSSGVRCNAATMQLEQLLGKFWEVEEVNGCRALSREESKCEEIFAQTTRRDPDGRFVVQLPLKQAADTLGQSRNTAEKRFYSTERKLNKDTKMKSYYIDFIQEYEQLGHMSLLNESQESKPEYYMPHHGVFRESSLTTKMRVVFDASAASSNGISLNDIQMVGPVLQDDLFSILIRFRSHAYVVSADIAKMYRQVLIEPSQRALQKIIWRSSPNEELKTYQLNTVTYGHASASFLAIRCLFELANECENSDPEIAEIIRSDFYVDDLLTGSDSMSHIQKICLGVSMVLRKGCFELRKWHSNRPEILKEIGDSDIASGMLQFGLDETSKVLGLTWLWHEDVLVYKIENLLEKHKCTKRTVLSFIARIFDPLGLLSPCTVLAKIFMQRLWASKVGWDDPLPALLIKEWSTYYNELPSLNLLKIERHAQLQNAETVELHGFADSSEKAYGACVYLRSTDHFGNVKVALLCAKSKVAPVKSLTIPKLELCGALLLARLVDKVIKASKREFSRCVLWSDSTIVLAWLRTSPNNLKVFVSNRVAEIQTLTEHYTWRHVPSQDNPADLVSRGLYPNSILNEKTWWQGPSWLHQKEPDWPNSAPIIEELIELKPHHASCLISSKPVCTNDFSFDRFSSFLRLQRVTAYILRFKANCSSPGKRQVGPLTLFELRRAWICLVRAAQAQTFFSEIAQLKHNKSICSSRIGNLSPFVDRLGLLRVGGRLKYSDFPAEKKHPVILMSKHILTRLIFEHEHKCLLHPGPQLLLASIREKVWPIAGRSLARSVTRKCLRCFRFNPSIVEPIMGNLPRDRSIAIGPFNIVGVDYAGPFLIRRNRSRVTEKCYIGVFVCFSTKALHLELISSLSAKSFIQALRRFVARRGKPQKIYSDNGTTFVGAQRELGEFLKKNRDQLTDSCVSEGIEWSFIPPYSPHFGGLWEAGVKSVKHHLKRVLANAHLFFEEFNTVLCQIESILNSRPLSPLSSDPNDFLPLSPAHFIIGRTLTSLPDENLENVAINRLTRYQLAQQLCQHFWSRWKREYICELQRRTKWKASNGSLSKGALVILKEENLPPSDWRLGRIMEIHPGADGIGRVATIQTARGMLKRSFSKICPLPLQD